jgi:ribosomal protein S18 acetylase RimI-like enzyme
MDPTALVFRDAEPSLDEGRLYARYLDDIAPGFRFTLGRRAVDLLAQAFTHPGHALSFEHVTFAELDGAIVGVVAGYTTEQTEGFDETLRRILTEMRVSGLRISALAKWLRYFGPERSGDFYVWLLAVSEELRSQGIGSRLMDHIEARARQEGCARCTLDADARNSATRRFYERRGMVVESRWPRSRLLPAMVLRFARPL